MFYSQRDKRWKNVKIGESKSTIGGHGCCLCSALMVLSKFYPFHNLTPDLVASLWKFVAIQDDPDPKYISWTQAKFKGMKFLWRNGDFQPERIITDPRTGLDMTEEAILKNSCASRDYGVIIQVRNPDGSQHWQYLRGKSLLGWTTVDPWTGQIRWKGFGFGTPYPRCTAWVLFQKTNI